MDLHTVETYLRPSRSAEVTYWRTDTPPFKVMLIEQSDLYGLFETKG